MWMGNFTAYLTVDINFFLIFIKMSRKQWWKFSIILKAFSETPVKAPETYQ